MDCLSWLISNSENTQEISSFQKTYVLSLVKGRTCLELLSLQRKRTSLNFGRDYLIDGGEQISFARTYLPYDGHSKRPMGRLGGSHKVSSLTSRNAEGNHEKLEALHA